MVQIIPKGENLLASLASRSNASFFPLSIADAYQDIPDDSIINVKGCSTVAFWIRISGGSNVVLRAVASSEENPSVFYQLPIQNNNASSISMQMQKYELLLNGDINFVFSVPTFNLIKYLKLQIKGNGGTLDDAKYSINYRSI